MVNGRLPAAPENPRFAADQAGIALKSNAGQIRIIQILGKSVAYLP
jgi:hypothetical protein